MDKLFSHLEKSVRHPAWVTIAALVGMASAGLSIVTNFLKLLGGAWTWIGPVGILLGGGFVVAALMFSVQKSKAWEKVPGKWHTINHLYRDTLCSFFARPPSNPAPDAKSFISRPDSLLTEKDFIYLRAGDKERLHEEERVLKDVCSSIADIYNRLTGRACRASVILVFTDDRASSQKRVGFEFAASVPDIRIPTKFQFKPEENTWMKAALKSGEKGTITHFISEDLVADSKLPESDRKQYKDKLPNWSSIYQAMIAVPIRRGDLEKRDGPSELGILKLDMEVPRRLNAEWQVQLLAAFADQMFNFMSLMRGHYQFVPPGPKPGESGNSPAPPEGTKSA